MIHNIKKKNSTKKNTKQNQTLLTSFLLPFIPISKTF